MPNESKAIASDSGHFYDAKTGEPRYTVTGKNGKERPSTLADARKFGWVPSVTTIISVLSKPGLENWKQDQVLLSAATFPMIGMTEDEWRKAVKAEAKLKAQTAAERGTRLHAQLEQVWKGDLQVFPLAMAVVIELEKVGIDPYTGTQEHSFAHPLGYGGKVDNFHPKDGWVFDVKTKDKIEDGKQLSWDEHIIQLAAYAHGLIIEAPRCLNVFVGIDDAKVVIIEHDALAIARGWELFGHALAIWKLRNGYDPTKAEMTTLEKIQAAGL